MPYYQSWLLQVSANLQWTAGEEISFWCTVPVPETAAA